MNPREIVMVTNAVAPDKLGGLERYVRELSATLVRKGCSVSVLAKKMDAAHPPTEIGDDGVRIVRYHAPDKRNPFFALAYPARIAAGIRRELGQFPNAIWHAHFPVPALPIRLMRRPYLYTFHAPVYRELLAERNDSYRLPVPLQRAAVASLRLAEQASLRGADRVVVLSEFIRSELALLSPRHAREAALLPGGIDTDWFTPDPESGPDLPASASPLLFAARRLTYRTGVRELVEAMPAVLAQHPGTRLVIAGSGGRQAEIESAIDRAGIAGSVRLVGRVSEEELRSWYRRADLSVLPTQELEGFGLSAAESLACGTPALGTPAGALPEILQPLNPLLVTDGISSAEIAQGLCRMLDQPDLLQALRTSARARVHPEMSWDGIADRYLELYDDFASRDRRNLRR